MNQKIILQIDGGGILGITPAIVLAELEKRLRIKTNNATLLIRDKLDLCCGTSTGAIMAAMVSAGVATDKIKQFYTVDGVDLFNNSANPFYTRVFKPKFDREPFIKKFNQIMATATPYKKPDVTIGDIPNSILFMATAYNLCSYKTEFVKSDDPNCFGLKLSDVITWSALSAAFYFGKVDAPDYQWIFRDSDTPPGKKNIPPRLPLKTGAVFQDGGQGTQNCTLAFALTEIFSRGWDRDNEIIIISLGTGSKTKYEAYESMVKTWNSTQAIKYLANQARAEATPIQIMAAEYIAKWNAKINLYRLDYEAKDEYSLDDTSHVAEDKHGAADIISSPVFNNMVSAIL